MLIFGCCCICHVAAAAAAAAVMAGTKSFMADDAPCSNDVELAEKIAN